MFAHVKWVRPVVRPGVGTSHCHEGTVCKGRAWWVLPGLDFSLRIRLCPEHALNLFHYQSVLASLLPFRSCLYFPLATSVGIKDSVNVLLTTVI